MSTINTLQKEYSSSLDSLDLDLIIASVIKKTREFVLAHPNFILNNYQKTKIKSYIKRRKQHEPLAYILKEKEFYGLNFKINKHVLIPRPETELLVEKTLSLSSNKLNNQKIIVIDVGTGSGNIIISIAKKIYTTQTFNTLAQKKYSISFYGTDISKDVLKIAKYNAKKNKIAKKIKFIKSDLLKYFFVSKKSLLTFKNSSFVIVANLPYLNYKIYSTSMLEVKNFEPKQALYAPQEGLYYYNNLFKEIKKTKKDFSISSILCLIEISPEQKNKIQLLAKKYFPSAKINFYQDLAKKWRSVLIKI